MNTQPFDLNHRGKWWATPERAQYVTACKQLRKVGTAHATGDGLRAMYASLVAMQHRLGERLAPNLFDALLPCVDDKAIGDTAREWLRDFRKAQDAAFSHWPKTSNEQS